MSLPVIPTKLPKKAKPGKGFSQEELVTPAPFQNPTFLKSAAGRTARLVCELEEFPRRMGMQGIRGTFLVFGSARARYTHQLDELIAAQKLILSKGKAEEAAKAKAKIAALEGLRWTSEWMEKTEELCRRLTEWALTPVGRRAGMFCRSNLLPNTHTITSSVPGKYYAGYQAPLAAAAAGDITIVDPKASVKTLAYTFEQPLVVCSGGGPGFMEAANKGAYEAGGVSMGVGVTLPFETQLNDFVTPGLHFQMETFFLRKYWEVYSAKCMICCPGGMGTCDEMFEVLTLMQCGHCQSLPVVLLGKSFWRECINFDLMAKHNMISQKEVEDICFTDDVDEAFNFIIAFILKEAEEEEKKLLHRAAAKL